MRWYFFIFYYKKLIIFLIIMCEDIVSDDEFNLMDEMDYCMDFEFLIFINEIVGDI